MLRFAFHGQLRNLKPWFIFIKLYESFLELWLYIHPLAALYTLWRLRGAQSRSGKWNPYVPSGHLFAHVLRQISTASFSSCHFKFRSCLISKKVPSWETLGKERGGSSMFFHDQKLLVWRRSSENLFNEFTQVSTLITLNGISFHTAADSSGQQILSTIKGQVQRKCTHLIICWHSSCNEPERPCSQATSSDKWYSGR